MDHKLKTNQFIKECEGLMNSFNNIIIRKNYLTKECKGLMNPKSFDLSFDLSFDKPINKKNIVQCKSSSFLRLWRQTNIF